MWECPKGVPGCNGLTCGIDANILKYRKFIKPVLSFKKSAKRGPTPININVNGKALKSNKASFGPESVSK